MELFNKIKKISEDTKGHLDSWDFKSFVLGFLALKYLSDQNANINYWEEDIERAFVKAEEEIGLKNVFEDVYNSLNKVETYNLNKLREEIYKLPKIESDQMGNVYEYLIHMYSANAGKTGGEFYTPTELSKLINLIALQGREIKNIYDPTCGTGSLLLSNNLENVEIYGQEFNRVSFNLARLNMLIHGKKKFFIARGDTLKEDLINKKYDAIVSNPPYSTNWDNESFQQDPRFNVTALAPKSKADFAFILHSLYHLNDNGIAAIVCFPGIMYRGGAEQKIRKYLIENDHIKTIIQLPANLFFGTSISTYIMVLAKNKEENKDKVLFIDASADFIKETNNNMLSDENINYIYSLCKNSKDVDYKSRLVDKKEIEEKDFDLSVSKYVAQEDKEEKIDIKALNKEIEETVSRQQELRKQIDKIILDIGDIDG